MTGCFISILYHDGDHAKNDVREGPLRHGVALLLLVAPPRLEIDRFKL